MMNVMNTRTWLEFIYTHGAAEVAEWFCLFYDRAEAQRLAQETIRKAAGLQVRINRGLEPPLVKRQPYHHAVMSVNEWRETLAELEKLGVLND